MTLEALYILCSNGMAMAAVIVVAVALTRRIDRKLQDLREQMARLEKDLKPFEPEPAFVAETPDEQPLLEEPAPLPVARLLP